jgi:hypothetical protein
LCLENAPTGQKLPFFTQKMKSNALEAASKMTTVHGSLSFVIPIFVICSQAVKVPKTLSVPIASADIENVKTQNLYALFKVMFL